MTAVSSTRLAPMLLGAAIALFIAGIATGVTAIVLLSLVAVAGMLVVLGIKDRADSAASSAPVLAATPTATEADDIHLVDETPAASESEPVENLLAQVQGLGPAKVTALSAAFPTAADLLGASPDELTRVPGVGPALAARIVATLA